jgi:pilus assembly protein Flp/PilA
MINILKKLLREEDGPTAVEYAVMLAMIVIVCLGAIRTMGNATSDSFDDSASQISAAMGS